MADGWALVRNIAGNWIMDMIGMIPHYFVYKDFVYKEGLYSPQAPWYM